MYPEYLQTWNTTVARYRHGFPTASRAYQAGQRYAIAHGLELLDPTPFSDTDQIGVTFNYANQHRLNTLDDLRRVADALTLGAPPQFQQDNFAQQSGNVKDGSVGFAWRQVEIAKLGSGVTWSIDGALIGSVPGATLSGDNVFVGFWDAFTSISDNPTLSFGLIDNLRVIQAVPEPNAVALGSMAAIGFFAVRRRK
jgi:hypothetical protein